MKLGEKQEFFAELLPLLLLKAHQLGFKVRLGDTFRDPRVHGEYGEKMSYSAAYSNHKLKLAINLNLFRNGVWQKNTNDHLVLGKWWEAQHPLCRWGGPSGDGNHYSLEHRGRW